MYRLFSLFIIFIFLVGCDQFNGKNSAREKERTEERAKAKVKQDKIDKAIADMNRQIREKKIIFENMRVDNFSTKGGKKSFENCEISEWTPHKLHIYSKDGLDVISFLDLDDKTKEEFGFDAKLAKLYSKYLKYKKKTTISGGSANLNYDPNRKKTDAELRKDAEAATMEKIFDYNFYSCKNLGNGDYNVQLHLVKRSRNGVNRIKGVFNGTVYKATKIFHLGTTRPRSSSRVKHIKSTNKFQLTLYTGEGKYFLSRSAAVESRYQILKLRNR